MTSLDLNTAPSGTDTVPFVDLHAAHAALRPEIDAAIGRVIDSGAFILGQEVAEFEAAFARFAQVRHCVGVSSGTEALNLAVRVLDIGPGDEVIVPAMTYAGTLFCIVNAGATPVIVDVLPDQASIDPKKILAAITPRTRAIIPVHLHGRCANMTAIKDAIGNRDISIIEDAAQAHGARHYGKQAGSMGTIGCFSFYPGKNLGALGDGGALTTPDDDIAAHVRKLINGGQAKKYHHEFIGMTGRLDALQAAVLAAKLPYLEAGNARRREHAAQYETLLSDTDGIDLLHPQEEGVYHVFTVKVNNRDEVFRRMQSAGIGVNIHYPFAVHEHECFKSLGHGPGDFPAAEDCARRMLSLPMFPELTQNQITRVVTALHDAMR